MVQRVKSGFRAGLRRVLTLGVTLTVFARAGAAVYAGLSLLSARPEAGKSDTAPLTPVGVMVADPAEHDSVTRRFGVSINAALIVLSGLQEDPRAADGDRAAMVDVVAGSARQILSTTVTTVGGFLPLILGGGGFWPPFAMSVAGGVALSVTLAFVFTPQLFTLNLSRPRPGSAPAGKTLGVPPSLRPEGP